LIGYAYDAALHCVACTLDRFPETRHKEGCDCTECDENGLPYEAIDSEGNPLSPIFVSTELEPHDCCDDCGMRFSEDA
jgi:hypothetical protein